MYNVHMKRYTMSEARQQFAELLDAAEAGQAVVIERRGVRFVVEAQRRRRLSSVRRKSIIEYMDPAVVGGEWTWSRTPGGLHFSSRRRAR